EDVEVDEHIVLEEIPAAEAPQVEEPESARGDGHIPVLRIEDLPAARGEPGEKGQHEVPREAGLGHDVELAAPEETVALGVVAAAVDDGIKEPRQVRRIHLT